MKRILVTGGSGYVGCVLVPRLLASGYEVRVYDILYYGREGLPGDPRLEVIDGDIRDTAKLGQALRDVDAVLHLACISNDPSFELDEELSRSVNYDCFEPMVIAAKEEGVRRFVYCSTSSVYGVSDAPEVTEDHPLVPVSHYNKYKGLCEPRLWRHQAPGFDCVTLRPATICGYSPRMRLDLTVNILTNHAVNKGKITVFGGSQRRPNLHIEDMCDAYGLMLAAPAERIAGETFNVGQENLSIAEIAAVVRDQVARAFPDRAPVEIETTPSDDPRSYHINSDKIRRRLGFKPRRGIGDAVHDLCAAFKDGRLPNSFEDDRYYNVRTMKALRAA